MNEESPPDVAAEETAEPVVTDYQAQMVLDVLRSEQNLVNGIAAGLFSSVVGAGIWAGIAIMSEYQIGWIAVAIGFAVGYSVRLAGKGLDRIFGIVGGVLALAGCALGNLGIVIYYVALAEGVEFMEVLPILDPTIAFDLLASTFEIMDLLFYAIAAYFGYKYAFRQVTEEEFNRALGKSI